MLYGCESRKVLRDIELRVRRFVSNRLRKIVNIRWFEHISEEDIQVRSGKRSVIEKIRQPRWRYYGHVLRTIDSRGRHLNGPLKAPEDLEDRKIHDDASSVRTRGRRTLTWTWRTLLRDE